MGTHRPSPGAPSISAGGAARSDAYPVADAQRLARAAQADALASKPMHLKPGSDPEAIRDIVRDAHQRGEYGLTAQEVRQELESRLRARGIPRRVDMTSVSGRVRELIQGGHLLRLSQRRYCRITGELVTVLVIPGMAARLEAGQPA